MKKTKTKKENPDRKKSHPWRLCPPGEHWVQTHSLKVPPSHKHPEGVTAIRHGHCAKNPTRKDQLYPDEIREMAKINFPKVREKPCPIDLGFKGKKKGNRYDDLIAGWTQC